MANSNDENNNSIFGTNNDVKKAKSYTTKEVFKSRWPYYTLCFSLIAIIAIATGLSYGLGPHEKREYSDYPAFHITERSKLLNRTEERYYIVFYQDNCAGCEYLKTDLFDHIDSLTEESSLIFLVDAPQMFNCSNCEEPENFIGIDDPQKIMINRTPSMLRVEKNTVSGYYLAYNEIMGELNKK